MSGFNEKGHETSHPSISWAEVVMEKPPSEPKKSKRAQNIVIAFISVMLGFYAFCAVVGIYSPPQNNYLSKVKFVGQTAVVDNGSGAGIMLAATEAASDELSKARIAGSTAW